MAVFRLPTDWEKRKPVNANLSLILYVSALGNVGFPKQKRRVYGQET